MKTKLILVTLLFLSYSCNTGNKPLADAEKDKIKSEIKEVVNIYIKGCEEVNFDLIKQPCLDSPDFVYVFNGYAFTFKEAVEIAGPAFETLLNQKVTLVDERYAFLDRLTVLYTMSFKCVANYKDGHSELYDPSVLLFVFKKIDESWMIVSLVESFVIQAV